MSNVFYGGGHSMKSGGDFAYWCLANTRVYYGAEDQFVMPKAVPGDYTTYSRLVGCASQAGVEIPNRYSDLLSFCETAGTLILPREAVGIRGAILFSSGIVYASMGDGKRIIYEESFRLIQKFINSSDDPHSLFEYGATIPGLNY